MSNVIACIDGSSMAPGVCDAASWASQQLNCPLSLLHVLDKSEFPTASQHNLSGNLGLDTQTHLLEKMVELDEQRNRLALEQGKLMLNEAQARASRAGAQQISTRQRHGNLVETLTADQNDMRLLVMGRQGEAHDKMSETIGSQLESVIRTITQPILIALPEFTAPERIMFAYDGSATAHKALTTLAGSPLFKGLACHLVMVNTDTDEHRKSLAEGLGVLEAAGFKCESALLQGDIHQALREYRETHHIDLLVMGAYGHSRIRQFLVGSTTTSMISRSQIPLLLLR
ncbi:universal stress protein UspA [Terasakiispira papahanaumokuakeensis]|uniref:Universal stress protein UspA n=1 Tax=Terasakiispira papahanaumokuakeensis TaxID=197479 RepID=A0A1E2V8L3_9GAMM|nr:universal stress protein [Terasakiispira papahanaumokuakeensis]ODC03176.1 universal stress protein UspA [Terasakiispira papahanaumokuakeensis]